QLRPAVDRAPEADHIRLQLLGFGKQCGARHVPDATLGNQGPSTTVPAERQPTQPELGGPNWRHLDGHRRLLHSGEIVAVEGGSLVTDGVWPESEKYIDEQFSHLPADVTRKMTWETAGGSSGLTPWAPRPAALSRERVDRDPRGAGAPAQCHCSI